MKKGDHAGAAEKFFDFRVADLAMGSGHFLTSAIDHIEQKMAAFLAEDGQSIPGVAAELLKLESAAKEALGEDSVELERSSLLRRQIARRCIYGLDINPIAVELSRVSIWIHTFVRGLPMSSLDHNLVCANSLTGIGTVEEALKVLVPDRKDGQISSFDEPIMEALSRARTGLIDASLLAETNSRESQAASRAAKKAIKDAQEAKLIFDAAVLTRIGLGSLVTGGDAAQIARLAEKPTQQQAVASLKPAHMPVLFPEVFLRDNGGFDVLVGNPPWEKLKVEEHQWWGLRFPGLRGIQMSDRTKKIKELKKTRPDLVIEYEKDIDLNNSARQIIVSGPYPGIGSGDIDLYKAFVWRNWQLLRRGGLNGLVLPYGAISGSGTEKWRRAVLEDGTFSNVVIGVNSRKWLFDIHQQKAIALVVAVKGGETDDVAFAGAFHSRESLEEGRDELAVVAKSDFMTWTKTVAFPLLSDTLSGQIFSQMRKSPNFDSTSTFEFRGCVELHETADQEILDTSSATGKYSVLSGGSFYLWTPDFGPVYAKSSESGMQRVFQKITSSMNQARSAFHGMGIETIDKIPPRFPRIAFRDVTNATNTRTCIPCLIPPETLLVGGAPYLLRRRGNECDEAFLLGVMSSIAFDWYSRKVVDGHLKMYILDYMPIPDSSTSSREWQRTVEISGRLAAVDKRFSAWAEAVGVKVDSVKTATEKESMIAELDALVFNLYGLSRSQVEHVFKTFHRGWDYSSRLAQVLAFYDQLPKVKS
jgi:hypothetical protein